MAADSEDEVFQMENDERTERCEGGESLPSLDSIVQMAKLQMEVIFNFKLLLFEYVMLGRTHERPKTSRISVILR